MPVTGILPSIDPLPISTTKGLLFGQDLKDALTPMTVLNFHVSATDADYIQLTVGGITKALVKIV